MKIDEPSRLVSGGTPVSYQYDADDRFDLASDPTETVSHVVGGEDRLAQELRFLMDQFVAVGDGHDAQGGTGHEAGLRISRERELLPSPPPQLLVIEYVIDGQGRRVGKKVNGTLVKSLLYQDQLEPIAELTGTTLENRFIYASTSHSPDVLFKGGQTYRLIADHLGSPRLILSVADGTVAQRISYEEFGRKILDTSAGFQAFGFGGGLYDGQTDLVRFGARDYDAVIGRWAIKDPIWFVGGDSNLYTFALNEPVNLRDPSGLAWVWNQSNVGIPYKPENGDYEPPSIIAPGEIANVDGVYSPPGTENPIALKIPGNCIGTIKPCGQVRIRCYIFKNIPRILSSQELRSKEFENWPNPFDGTRWPYATWPEPSK